MSEEKSIAEEDFEELQKQFDSLCNKIMFGVVPLIRNRKNKGDLTIKERQLLTWCEELLEETVREA